MPIKKSPAPVKKIKNVKAAMPATTQNQMADIFRNGLTEAIVGIPNGSPSGFGAPLSQTDTIFYNLRWYLISNMRQPLSQAYAELGIVKTVVDVPVDDAMRGGVDIKSKELSPEDIEKLVYTMEQEDDFGVMGEGQKWKRLFGGAGIIILTDQDPQTPLNIAALTEDEPLEFRAVDMWELFWDKQNIEGDGTPLDNNLDEYYRYYGKNLHKSRVMILKGEKAPSFIRPRLRGWGLSVAEILVRSINQYLKANDLTFEVLDEFKIDIFKIDGLSQTLLSANGTEAVKKRIGLANYQKNYQNAITMDAKDDFAQKELSFQGLAETMTQIRMQIASDLRMPLTKVFGISASGFSSGEDDIENYNAMVESTIRQKSKHHLLNMIKIRCQKLFGFVPDDLTIEFKPLRILSSEQEENVKTQKLARIMSLYDKGLMSAKEAKDAANKDKLASIQLDTTTDALEIPGTEGEEGGGAEEKAPSSPKSKTQAPLAKNSGNFDESKHPRAADGKFGEGGGTPADGKNREKLPDGKEIVSEHVGKEIRVKIEGVGNVMAYEKDGGMMISSAAVKEADRGKGYGIKMYEKLAEECGKKKIDLISDRSVQESATHMYKALAKRGYEVIENPNNRKVTNLDGTVEYRAPIGQHCFTVKAKKPEDKK